MNKQEFRYEPVESFGKSMTSQRPWDVSALKAVEQLNGRVAMVGFAAALVGEWRTGFGPAGQVLALVRWYLS
ncbi:MAG: chlorophyll a/b-binding protein [Vulcanococcus sp.]